jgi:hypothetical protein
MARKCLTRGVHPTRLCSFCAQLQLTPAHSSLLQPKSIFSQLFGLPLILWTPSRHNCRREVHDGQTASEFHPRF